MKRKYKLILVAGARPNFMKIAPIVRSLKLKPFQYDLPGLRGKLGRHLIGHRMATFSTGGVKIKARMEFPWVNPIPPQYDSAYLRGGRAQWPEIHVLQIPHNGGRCRGKAP